MMIVSKGVIEEEIGIEEREPDIEDRHTQIRGDRTFKVYKIQNMKNSRYRITEGEATYDDMRII